MKTKDSTTIEENKYETPVQKPTGSFKFNVPVSSFGKKWYKDTPKSRDSNQRIQESQPLKSLDVYKNN